MSRKNWDTPSAPTYLTGSPMAPTRCISNRASHSASKASGSPRFIAATPRSTISTFSCDIALAEPESPDVGACGPLLVAGRVEGAYDEAVLAAGEASAQRQVPA